MTNKPDMPQESLQKLVTKVNALFIESDATAQDAFLTTLNVLHYMLTEIGYKESLVKEKIQDFTESFAQENKIII